MEDLQLAERNAKTIHQETSSRDYHNALERKRRKLISAKFEVLKNSIPDHVYGGNTERVPRCIILKSACHYINSLEKANSKHMNEIEKLRQENEILETEILRLENYASTDEWEEIVDECLK